MDENGRTRGPRRSTPTRVVCDNHNLSMLSPPFDRWPVQHQDRHYGYAWYCGGGIIVSHITTSHGSVAAAHSYHDFESRMLREHADEMKLAGGLFAIHDWRAMVTYDAEGRRVWQERMRAHEKGYLRGSVVCVARTNALLRMAVQAVNLVASMVHGAKVELTSDIEGTLRAHGIVGPPPART
jgi:hypothetical protein